MLSLTYVSSATQLMDGSQLVDLLHAVRPKNESVGITGMLLYRDGNIIQTLEGPDDAVKSTYHEICRDPRHKGVILLLDEEITERRFPDWSMGFRDVTAEPLDRVEGYTDFLSRDRTGEAEDIEPAERLLRSFRESMR